LTLQSTLKLKKGDQVCLMMEQESGYDGMGFLYDDSYNHFTHFTGFMLQEEIVASL
jgi:hypothetical protein